VKPVGIQRCADAGCWREDRYLGSSNQDEAEPTGGEKRVGLRQLHGLTSCKQRRIVSEGRALAAPIESR
jgi:hypothetical protein